MWLIEVNDGLRKIGAVVKEKIEAAVILAAIQPPN